MPVLRIFLSSLAFVSVHGGSVLPIGYMPQCLYVLFSRYAATSKETPVTIRIEFIILGNMGAIKYTNNPTKMNPQPAAPNPAPPVFD